MMNHDIIIRPVISENSMQGVADKCYTFEVAKNANKIMIKKAVEDIFGVKVVKVNTINVRAKEKRLGMNVGKTSAWKKAIVTLSDDSKAIEFFEGMM